MNQPCIITVAITGSMPRTSDNPVLPVEPARQIESTQEAFEAGAAVVHIHVRNDDESPGSDPDKFAQVQEGVKTHCPGMIIQFSTGGRGRDGLARGSALHLRPDMASLTTGSVNFPTEIYENPPDLVDALAGMMQKFGIKPEIEVFDSAMLYNAVELVHRKLISSTPHAQFVMGIRNAMPVRRQLLEFLISELKAALPGATWGAMGISKNQFQVNKWCLELGGHCRTGLEDNIRFDATRLAKSNAELVEKIVAVSGEYGRRPATAAEARQMLGLRTRLPQSA